MVNGIPTYTVTTNNTILDKKKVVGRLRFAPGVTGCTFKRGMIKGHTSDLATGVPILVDGIEAGENIIEDSVIGVDPEFRTWKTSAGIQGRRFKVRRCDIYGVVDGYLSHGFGGIKGYHDIEGSYIHDIQQFPNPPDTTHTDGSHPDSVVCQGMVTYARVVGNYVRARYSSGIFFTNDVAGGYDTPPVVTDNWLDQQPDGAPINYKAGSYGTGGELKRNKFDIPSGTAGIVIPDSVRTALGAGFPRTGADANINTRTGNPVVVWNGTAIV